MGRDPKKTSVCACKIAFLTNYPAKGSSKEHFTTHPARFKPRSRGAVAGAQTLGVSAIPKIAVRFCFGCVIPLRLCVRFQCGKILRGVRRRGVVATHGGDWAVARVFWGQTSRSFSAHVKYSVVRIENFAILHIATMRNFGVLWGGTPIKLPFVFAKSHFYRNILPKAVQKEHFTTHPARLESRSSEVVTGAQTLGVSLTLKEAGCDDEAKRSEFL